MLHKGQSFCSLLLLFKLFKGQRTKSKLNNIRSSSLLSVMQLWKQIRNATNTTEVE